MEVSTSLYPVLRTCFACKTRTKYKCAQAFAHWTLTTLRSVEFSDFTQLQRSECKDNRKQGSRQICRLTINLAILSMKSFELAIWGSENLTKWQILLGTSGYGLCHKLTNADLLEWQMSQNHFIWFLIWNKHILYLLSKFACQLKAVLVVHVV